MNKHIRKVGKTIERKVVGKLLGQQKGAYFLPNLITFFL